MAVQLPTKIEILLGNEAMGLGLVEQGCGVATAYPGTPSTEILNGVVKFKKRTGRHVYTEWSTNEKVAFEVALAASWSGVRAAVAMKQVGLNVASDPFFNAAYTGVKAGFIVLSADDPGPISSQTEQDSRLIALAAKVPVLDPSDPEEAHAMIADGFQISERYALPVLLRPTTRVCHGVQGFKIEEVSGFRSTVKNLGFQRKASHWTATPKARYQLHQALNRKLEQIEADFAQSPLNRIYNENPSSKIGIVASGATAHTALQVVEDMGLMVPVLKIGTPYPLPRALVDPFVNQFEQVIVLEEPDICIELQITAGTELRGRRDGTVPSAGELGPDVVSKVIREVLETPDHDNTSASATPELANLIETSATPRRPPSLCPGCSHRSVFYQVKQEFGLEAIYPGDIGCYSLGTNLEAVDTFLNMGASVSMATGFYHANRQLGDKRPIIATIGDSTFLHGGISPLINATHSGARFILLILDNHVTAMTGFQPTCESEHRADGSEASRKVKIVDLVRASGVEFVREVDPFRHGAFGSLLREAHAFTRSAGGGVAVLIANRPCALNDPVSARRTDITVAVADTCDGCRECLDYFECPAMFRNEEKGQAAIDYGLCVNCGQCLDACSKGHIIAVPKQGQGPVPV